MGAPRFDGNGNIVCWYGSVQDINTPSDPAKEQLSRSETLNPPSTVLVMDRSSKSAEEQRRRKVLLEVEILDSSCRRAIY